jgi:hypothetical protein
MTTPITARTLALIYAAQARIEAMKVENEYRQRTGYGPSYGEDDFLVEAEKLEELAVSMSKAQ